MRNQCYGDQFLNFDSLGPYWRLRVWGLKTRPKCWPTLGFFSVTFYLNIVIPNFLTLKQILFKMYYYCCPKYSLQK